VNDTHPDQEQLMVSPSRNEVACVRRSWRII